MSEDRAPTAEPVVKLGVRLKQVREKSGQSLRAVARQLGVSPSFLSQLENGKSQPSVATLYSLTQLLDVSIDELFAADHVEVAEESQSRSPGSASVATALEHRAARRGQPEYDRQLGDQDVHGNADKKSYRHRYREKIGDPAQTKNSGCEQQ